MRQTLLIGLIAATVSLPALAGHDDRDDNYRDANYQDNARVISVAPQFERVNTPRQECRTEYVRESVYEAPRRSVGGAVIGGVAGGLLGSTVGRGNGRVVAAAVGAGVGAIVGDRVDNDRYSNRGRERVETRPVESCVTVDNWSQVPAGYLVNYEYNGRQYSTVTDRDPGRFIPVQVQVRPNGYVTNVSYSQYGRGDDDDDRGRGYGHYKRKHHDRHGERDRNYW
jgi:uncharacterized protein YcfJ